MDYGDMDEMLTQRGPTWHTVMGQTLTQLMVAKRKSEDTFPEDVPEITRMIDWFKERIFIGT